ncbi:MAG: hypothetical protein HQM12_11640 [SAR324 cluster bacterium]|nr:hypothetical protein [SAR324 cluster bacterium]
MLQVIMNYAEIALMDLTPDVPIYSNLKGIESAATHSANITRRLLTFARKQAIQPQTLNLNDSVSGMLKMLRTLIGEKIDLIWIPTPSLWNIRIDPTQMDQILTNLCVNARDAIEWIGTITLETRNLVVEKTESNNGGGISNEILPHIFEPFFTTKEQGKGTGLGLAMIYGIVKQNEGFIEVDSIPGKETSFLLYFPRF